MGAKLLHIAFLLGKTKISSSKFIPKNTCTAFSTDYYKVDSLMESNEALTCNTPTDTRAKKTPQRLYDLQRFGKAL